MNYNEAYITAHYEGQESQQIDLEDVRDENELVDHLWAAWFGEIAFGDDEDEASDRPSRDDFAGNIWFTRPKGFAQHLFEKEKNTGGVDLWKVGANFDELLEAWQGESDSDRREAMGEYLDDMGANDLSNFDEAYQGQWSSGAAFAEQIAEDLGEMPKEIPSWIVIDWEASWERGLRFDYHITNSGHVFRNL